MKTNHNSADRLVHHQSRWTQHAWPLAIIAVGLAATLVADWVRHPSLARIDQWGTLPQWWMGGVALTLLAAVIVWVSRRHSAAGSAAALDEEYEARNRLETAVAFQNDNSPLVRAQRGETEEFIRRQRVRNRRAAGLACLRTLVLVLILAHFATLLSWARPWNAAGTPIKLAAIKKQPVAEPQKPAEAVKPKASIQWESPESEINAMAIEEIPLKAVATSTTGLRDLTLEVAVNGETQLKTPVTLDELKQPGKHTIETSIYLDQLVLQPFDIVSYNLRAHQIDAHTLPDTVSPMQFVEIKPLQQDVGICECEGACYCFNYISAIKAAQLRLMKENYALGNSDLTKDDAKWKTDNRRVGNDQAELAEKTTETVSVLETNGTSENIIALVKQAQPFMVKAAKQIQATDNQPALVSQGRALALITEVEKYLQDKVSRKQSMVKNVKDPFKKERHADPKFKKTKADEIALLAREQARLAGDLAHPELVATATKPSTNADASLIAGTPSQRETQIRKRLVPLVGDSDFAPEVIKHLENGDAEAKVSQQQSDENNFPAALEPAAESARELRLAVNAIFQAGKKVAKNELADALRSLNQASDLLRQAVQASSDPAAQKQVEAAAKITEDAAKQLAEAALAQQENGSTNAADRMMTVAQLMNSPALKQMLAQLKATPRDPALAQAAAARLDDLANRAELARNQEPLSRAELARLVERMERTRASLQRFAAQSTSAGQKPGPNQGQAKGEGKNPGQGQGQPPEAKPSESVAQQNTQPTEGLAQTDNVGGGHPFDESRKVAPLQYGQVPSPSGTAVSHFGAPLAPNAEAAEPRRLLALQLLDELQEDSLDAMAVTPKSTDLTKLRQILRSSDAGSDSGVVVTIDKIDPPLEGVIKMLRIELSQFDRHYQLTDQQLAQAPPAYRPAVADYFERLSHDYGTNGLAATLK